MISIQFHVMDSRIYIHKEGLFSKMLIFTRTGYSPLGAITK
jgi:hypothetical protein